MNQREQLIGIAIEQKGNWSKIAKALKDGAYYEHSSQPCITIYDEVYPDCLRSLRFPPWVLFYEGDLSLLRKPKITIIGSREVTPYGKWTTVMCAEALYNRYVLVSGLAKGVDGLVHATALRHGGDTIGIIGSGLQTHYPKENEVLYKRMAHHGLILSEYPYDVGVRKEHFPWRNRILAALGEATIVTQASLKSGTMLTVNEAIALGRDVWCIPWPYGEENGLGNNRLIFQGANILYTPDQLQDFVSARKSLAL